MQLLVGGGQTIKIDRAAAFYRTANTAEVTAAATAATATTAVAATATAMLIMIENMPGEHRGRERGWGRSQEMEEENKKIE